MIKSYHTLFLKTLDNILDSANSPYLNFTLTKNKIIELTSPKIELEKIYSDKKDNFLVKHFDHSTEQDAIIYLIDSALDHLVNKKYLKEYLLTGGIKKYQITHKGFLKIHIGFFKKYENDKLKLESLKSQQNLDNNLNILKTLTPYILAILTFIIGILL